ncbi:MAG TPA: hypothetical protein PK891_04650, partial [Bacteroidales bacterium]|nr:hypothetical protein [Bacteroidales bacterium]
MNKMLVKVIDKMTDSTLIKEVNPTVINSVTPTLIKEVTPTVIKEVYKHAVMSLLGDKDMKLNMIAVLGSYKDRCTCSENNIFCGKTAINSGSGTMLWDQLCNDCTGKVDVEGKNLIISFM